MDLEFLQSVDVQILVGAAVAALAIDVASLYLFSSKKSKGLQLASLLTNYTIMLFPQPPEVWDGGVGFVSKEIIQTHCPDIQILRCGPPPMNKARPWVDTLTHSDIHRRCSSSFDPSGRSPSSINCECRLSSSVRESRLLFTLLLL